MQMPAVKKYGTLVVQIIVEIAAFGGLAYALLCVTPLAAVGIVTTVTSLSFKVGGQPAQLIKLYKIKSSESVSWVAHGIATVSYISWCAYGLRENSWVIVASQALGTVGSLLTFHLVIHYRLNKAEPIMRYGLMFWLWDHETGKWRGSTHYEFTTARNEYLSLSGDGFRPYSLPLLNSAGMLEASLWYWSLDVSSGSGPSRLHQGMVTDANVPGAPSFGDMIAGMTRLGKQLAMTDLFIKAAVA